MLKALVFDFDGVIVDTETAWYDIYKDWLKERYQYDLKPQDYLRCVGADTRSLIAFLQQEVDSAIDIRSFEETAVHEFVRRTSELPVKDGVVSLLLEAKKRGLRIALATSATRKKPVTHLTRLQLLTYFEALATAELVAHIKPEPDLFLKAASLLSLKPEECLAIEDSQNGLLSAQRAGMPCLIVPNDVTRHGTFQGYFKQVPSLSQVDLDVIINEFNAM